MNLKILLAVSLFANALLGFYAFRPHAPSAANSADNAEVKKPLRSQRSPATSNSEALVTNTIVKRFTWESVESPDYKEYIANLRSVGCPDETIRDIIVADVNKLYDQKKKLVRGTPKKFEYWKPGNAFFGGGRDPEITKQIRALDEERNGVLRALGIEPDFKTEVAQLFNPFDTMMDFLPDQKKGAVAKLFTDFQSKMAETVKDGRPDGTMVAKLQKEMEVAVKQLLTPEEALQYDLRMSVTANMMRDQVAGFDPNEEEFMQLFKLRKSFDDEFSMFGRGEEDDATQKKRTEAHKELDAQIKQTLGDARYKITSGRRITIFRAFFVRPGRRNWARTPP
ncbi:MAG TPA: hypothetical protein VK530_08320 [Candidatus Acidoferrum sp.]|nr:hypothetical protein [Candidatus Acidoferrum sp.]